MEINDEAEVLISAICEGRLEDARKIAASSNLSEAQQFRCVCLAAFFDHSAIFEVLFLSGFVHSDKTTNECPALTIATHNGNVRIAEILLEKGNIMVPDSFVDSLLYLAVNKGNENVVRLLLDQDADVNLKIRGPFTSIHLAAEKECLHIIEHLLMKGVDVNSRYPLRENIYGDLVLLHRAVEKGSTALVELMTKYEADVNADGGNGLTPLFIAVGKGYTDITCHLIEKGANINARLSSIIEKDFSSDRLKENQMLQHFLGLKASNIKSFTDVDGGQTPLHVGIRKGHEEVVKILLETGADVNAYDSNSNTALRLAVETGNPTIVEVILNRYPDVSDERNRSALHLAIKSRGGNFETIIKKLTEHGFNTSSNDAKNSELLFYAVQNNHFKIVQDLVKFGADVNETYQHKVYPNYHTNTVVLHAAVKNGYEDMVKFLLENGAKLNVNHNLGFSPLYFAVLDSNLPITKLLLTNETTTPEDADRCLIPAVETNCLDIIRLLLSHGADVNKTCIYGGSLLVSEGYNYRPANEKSDRYFLPPDDSRTALFIAAQKGHGQIVQFLVESGANVYFRARNDVTPFLISAVCGHLEVVQILVESGVWIDDEDLDGRTSLYLAAEFGHKDIVNFLLERGARVNFKASNGSTPLLTSIENGYPDIFELLLKFNKVDFSTEKYRELFLAAAQNGQFEIIKTILTYCPKDGTYTGLDIDKAVHYAAEYGHCNAIQFLLKYNSRAYDSHLHDDYDKTPLLISAKKGHHKLIEMLLRYGAKVNQPGFRSGKTALFISAEKGHLKAVEILLKGGASTAIAEYNNNMSAFHIAAQNNRLGVVKLMLKYDAEVNIKDGNGNTPFLISAEKGHFEIVQTLLESGVAVIESTNRLGLTALHLAAQCGHADVVELLLEHGAAIDSITGNGKTSLLIATEWCHIESVDILLKHGANIDAVDLNGETSLELAAKYGYDEVARLLLENGADANFTTEHGVPLLLISAEKGHLQTVKVLLEFGAVFDLTNCNDTASYLKTTLKNWKPQVFQTVIEWGSANGNILSEANFCCLSSILNKIDTRELDYPYSMHINDMINIFDKHYVKMLAAALFATENSSIITDQSRSYSAFIFQKIQCEPEIDRLKAESVNFSNFSLYDILVTNNINQLALIIRKTGITEFPESEYERKYRWYSSILNVQFKKGNIRNELLRQGTKACHFLFPLLTKLPYELVESKIMFNLSNIDLRNFIKVCIILGRMKNRNNEE